MKHIEFINDNLLDKVSEQAKASPRLRMNYNFHQSLDEKCHRMLNALEPGTVRPIHRHRGSSESVVILRGKIRWIFYDENGVETERVGLDADGGFAYGESRERWYLMECLESGAVKYRPGRRA